VAVNFFRGSRWQPDYRKTWVSPGGNLLVWGFVVVFLGFTHIHLPLNGDHIYDLRAPLPALLTLLAGWGVCKLLQNQLSRLSHLFLRMPLRTGLFPNFDRIRFLRASLPQEKLRRSAMRVIMTATDITHGSPCG